MHTSNTCTHTWFLLFARKWKAVFQNNRVIIQKKLEEGQPFDKSSVREGSKANTGLLRTSRHRNKLVATAVDLPSDPPADESALEQGPAVAAAVTVGPPCSRRITGRSPRSQTHRAAAAHGQSSHHADSCPTRTIRLDPRVRSGANHHHLPRNRPSRNQINRQPNSHASRTSPAAIEPEPPGGTPGARSGHAQPWPPTPPIHHRGHGAVCATTATRRRRPTAFTTMSCPPHALRLCLDASPCATHGGEEAGSPAVARPPPVTCFAREHF